MPNYRQINREVMLDTQRMYQSLPELQEAIRSSISRQYMVAHEDDISQPVVSDEHTQYICSGKRSFEAAASYARNGKKVAVLNFANNHGIGGAPFSAGAQEESLCRCSTLYPCLCAMRVPFYEKHIEQYTMHIIDEMGNDDLIYTPDVVVFKTDERTDPVYPKMMPQADWYKVDVITCAAPEMRYGVQKPNNYEQVIASRIKKILDVAAKEHAQAIILGAWGCGAFHNDSQVVSSTFYSLLKNYNFEIVEFALATHNDVSNSIFARH